MKKNKLWIRLGIVILSLLLILDIGAGYFFYNLAIDRNVKEFLIGNADLEVSAEAMDVFIDGDWRSWAANQDFEQWEMESYDGLNLQGYYLEADAPTNKTVVFAHGYLGSARDMALFGQYYYEELGYNMFTADLRGHGQSEGDYIGFGWHDRLDYLGWINRIIEELGPKTEIVLHGVSMGAATVLMTSGEELPSNVKAVVADSPYTNVADLFGYQLERMFHLPKVPIIPTTGLVTKFKAGYTLKEASALDQVKKATVPILYIHGSEDAFVPAEMAKELYENTASDAELLLVDGASHGESIVIAHDTYVKKLSQFLTKYVVD
ncbi:alpha/beta fold hydrolase [Oceanobacillus sp. 143]|uniref:Alpha/beta hydrolase n=1 Tax=Oceanobacillus zhaokaii TaxID=2052660 RepID=A0A345PF64_9BACI|nr:alpha/beta hydrolase [Oceanobacillus zhaokaii]AXI08644.1 alpha/beta hydrolase [Oceanobacillus zhaokaii]QGS68423.1 alpha/beta fold hydrolase [Oceanobacillus sp. 143]